MERFSNDSYEFRTKVIFGTEVKNIGEHCAHELLFYLLRLSTRKCITVKALLSPPRLHLY